MSYRFKPAVVLAIMAGLIALAVFAIHRYRYGYVRSDAEMVALLPQRGGTVFFADFSLLRQAGVLKAIAGAKAGEDPEYRAFVQETDFDYTHDIDTATGEVDGAQVFFVARGRFSWSQLRRYAQKHGGSCDGDFCDLPSMTPGRWVSFLPVQANVIGFAVGPDRTAAYQLSPRRERTVPPVPPEPVWVNVSHQLLEYPESLPAGARIFAISLAPASTVVISLGPNGAPDAPYRLQLNAGCATAAKADVVYGQLETQTKAIRAELMRERQPISRGDLTGLLASGVFQEHGTTVIGQWPIYRELLEKLEQ